ncbi:flavodoxin family protein [Geobacter benzoatilyticus]|uniref:Flavodoxin family protein n=1 Tax=Geobacter benzoatilyticus TaxID=2815309 RepID=A0ABX7Q321_9BACT|nr:flavodoxin family protein [Geobacter benzoatilyticus]QSV45500.1 flavodoxin family protein [Geobacter benzoatilyticus]
MAKNVLILSCSPRKEGNSDLLCDQFALGATEAGCRVEKISAGDRRINYCTACDACQGNGGACVQKDDMAEILDKMISADVIVMATPVYFSTMNAQTKALIDRTYARYTAITGKEFYFIMTAAVGDKELLELTLESLRKFASCLTGSRERGVIYGTGAWNKGDITKSPAMDLAYEMGRNLQ